MACSFENSVELNKALLSAYDEQGMSDCYCITAPPFFKYSQAALYDWSAELIDFALLQQDGFDPIDCLCPMERQKYMADLIKDICDRDYIFDDYEECREWFKELINLLRQMNYNTFKGEAFMNYQSEINKHLASNGN